MLSWHSDGVVFRARRGSPVHALLLRRLADNTLLPGTNTEEEVTYYAGSQAFAQKAHGTPGGDLNNVRTVPP